MFVVASSLLIVAFILSFLEEYLSFRVKLSILAGMAVIMVCMSTFKDLNTTADARFYLDYFQNNDDPLIEVMTEPTYIYLSRLLIYMGLGIEVLLFIYAIITIPTKLAVINKLTPYVFTALLIYIPAYYLLQDVVQIRAGAAAAFLFLSLYMVCEKKYVFAVLAFITAILFHYSAIAFLPVFIWGNRKLYLPVRILLALLVPLGFLMYFKEMDLLSFLPSSLTQGKVDFYKDSAEKGSQFAEYVLPYKNFYLMVRCLLLFVCLIFYKSIIMEMKYANIIMVMLAASIFVKLSMSTIPVIAGRLSDLYGITDCIAFSYCLSFVKPSWIVKCGIFGVGLYVLVYNYLHSGFIV